MIYIFLLFEYIYIIIKTTIRYEVILDNLNIEKGVVDIY